MINKNFLRKSALQTAVHKTSHCLPEGSLNGGCRRNNAKRESSIESIEKNGKFSKKGKEKLLARYSVKLQAFIVCTRSLAGNLRPRSVMPT